MVVMVVAIAASGAAATATLVASGTIFVARCLAGQQYDLEALLEPLTHQLPIDLDERVAGMDAAGVDVVLANDVVVLHARLAGKEVSC